MSTTYISLPAELNETDLCERQKQLFLKVNSLEGNLYSIGAAVSECRKELNAIREALAMRRTEGR